MKRTRKTELREEVRMAIIKIVTEVANNSDEIFAELPDDP